MHRLRPALQLQHPVGVEQGGDVGHRFAVTGEQLAFRLPVRVAERQAEQEAVELGFGQGIGAGLLQRVLGGDDEERRGQGPGGALQRHLALFHGLEQGALGLGGGAVDLVGEQDAGEDRAGVKGKTGALLFEHAHPEDVAGQHVAGALDAAEIKAEHAGQGLGQGGLADAGDVLDEQVALGEQRAEGEPDLRFLAEHEAPGLGDHPGEQFGQGSGTVRDGGRNRGGCGKHGRACARIFAGIMCGLP